jgi:hypothetical protein
VSALGIASTYGAFVLRGAVFPGGVMDPDSTLPYVMLATYWITFEAAGIVGARLQRREAAPSGSKAVSVLALNAVGFMGAMLVTVPADNPRLLSIVLFAAASAYVASAVLRAWLLPGWRARHATDEPFDSAHGATAIAAALFAVAIGLRFHGNRENLARLLEAQLLITAGLTLGDVWLRRMGSIGLALAAANAWLFALWSGSGTPVFSWPVDTTTAVMGLTAIACYANREAIYRRGATPVWAEGGFTWMATTLVATICVRELEPAHQALAGLVLSAVLLEIGFRRTTEYVQQSYVAGAVAAYGMLTAFLFPTGAGGTIPTWGPGPTTVDEWTVLPAGVVLAAAVTWRLLSRATDAPIPGRLMAAGVSASLATAFLLVFEWRVLSPNAIAPVWALTAVALALVGSWRYKALLRWQGYVVALVALGRAAGPLLGAGPDTNAQTAAIAVVIAGVYVVAYLGRRAIAGLRRRTTSGTSDSVESAVATALSVAATGAFVLFKWRVLPDLLVGPAWTFTATVLLALGFWRRVPNLRWQGYALLGLGALRTGRPVFSVDEPTTAAIVWLGLVIAVLYGAGLVVRRAARAAERAGAPESAEHSVGAALLLGATGLLAALIVREARPSMVTLALGLQGLALMFAGLVSRERVLRVSGLGLLLACILKLFVSDLRELEAIARIMSFVILGLFLLAISWTYTRYREQIRKFL